MTLARRAIHSVPLLYLVMLWPSRPVVVGLFDSDYYYAWMMYESGFWSVYLLIFTFSVTPILMLLSRVGIFLGLGRWLLKRRRHFGLGSFIYASLHLVHYVKETWSVPAILRESVSLEYATGWLAFLIFAALAITSNRTAARALGARWKTLHRSAYAAAALSALHWYLLDFSTSRVLFWVSMLAMTKGVHWALLQWRNAQTHPTP